MGWSRRAAGAAAVVALLCVAGCSADDPTTSPTPSAEPTGDPTTGPAEPTRPPGGPIDDPATVTPGTDLLDWAAVDAPIDDRVTVGSGWQLRVVGQEAEEAQLTPDDGEAIRIPAPEGFRIDESLLTDTHAVVVASDTLEEVPGTATVIDLASGEQRVLDGRSAPPTVNGGTWAIGDGRLLHATLGEGSAYCLAEVDLRSLAGEASWCAEPRHGFRGGQVSGDGVTLTSFDDARPVSCRTAGTVEGGELVALEGPNDCKAWDVVAMPGGYVWTEIPKERRNEDAHAYARLGEEWYDLGPALSNSLTRCGPSAWFTREGATDGGSSQVLRWDERGLSVVYETPADADSLIDGPRCGGSAITLTAMTEAGDEQVTAAIE